MFNAKELAKMRAIFGGGSGGSSKDVKYVTFMDDTGTVELYVKPVATGDDCVDVVAKGLLDTPVKESAEEYSYLHTGWSLTAGGEASATALAAVNQDRTVYAAYASVFGSGQCGDNAMWTLYSDGEMVISGYGDMTDYAATTDRPWDALVGKIKILRVDDGITRVGARSFTYATALISVSLPNSVTCVGRSAFFGCDTLPAIDIPDSVTSIEAQAFYSCATLSSVRISNKCTSIGASAFSRCTALTAIDIPDLVVSIGERAFEYCDALSDLSLGNVESIGGYSFNSCKALYSITIPASVDYIGNMAFGGLVSTTGYSVAFADTTTWTVTDLSGVSTTLSASDLSANGALYLRSTYRSCSWVKT